MNLHLLSIFLIIMFVASCISFHKYSNPGAKIVHEIQIKNNKKLAKAGIYQCSSGGYGVGPLVTNGMYITNRYRFTSIDEARAFFCAFVDEYMQPFKDEPRIRPYLHNFPLKEENFEFFISFVDETGEQLQRPYIETIMNRDNKIYYSTFDPLAKPPASKSHPVLLVETFEEARAKLKNRER
jgi:hypothetical protein